MAEGDDLGGEQHPRSEERNADAAAEAQDRQADGHDRPAGERKDRHRRNSKERRHPNEKDPGNQAERSMVRLTKWLAGFTAISGICSLFAVTFTGLQWREMHESGKQLDRQIAIAERQTTIANRQSLSLWRAANAADNQAALAAQQVGIARKGLNINEKSVMIAQAQASDQAAANRRPLLATRVNFNTLPSSIDVNQTILAIVSFENQSPASVTLVRSSAAMGFVADPETSTAQSMSRRLSAAPVINRSVAVGQQENVTLTSPKPPADAVAAFNGGRIKLIIVGSFEYRTVAGDVHHRYGCVYLQKGEGSAIDKSDCPTPADD